MQRTKATLALGAVVALVASCQIDLGLSGSSDFFACTTNADCLTGEICSNKLCVTGVAGKADGGAKNDGGGTTMGLDAGEPDTGTGGGASDGGVGAACDGNGSGCNDAALMCMSGVGWDGGYCTKYCGPIRSSCAGGSLCDSVGGAPTICLQRCTAASQCRGGYVCANGGCAPDCRTSPSLCGGGVCTPSTGVCASDCRNSGCPANETCATSGQCIASGGTCPGSGCPAGMSCQSGQCVSSSAGTARIGDKCAVSGDCTSGLDCYHLAEPGSHFCSKACKGSVDCDVASDCYGGFCYALCPMGTCARPDFACAKNVIRPSCFPNCTQYPDECAPGAICKPNGTCG